jgi:class 3 adenylate cyclase/HAMP domain-containing protein
MARTIEVFVFRSLRAKFLALIVPLVLLSTVIVFGISELAARREANRKLHDKLEELVEIQSAVLSESLWNVADEQIELILAAIAIDTDVLGAIVYDEANNPIGAVGSVDGIDRQEFFAERDITYASDIIPEIIGRLAIALTDARVQAESEARLLVVAGSAALLLLSVVAIAVVANRRTIGIPLERLLKSINQSRQHGERIPVDWTSRDEIGEVVSAFNEMQVQQNTNEADLRRARDTLEERVTERTAELLAATNESTRTRAQLTAAIETISEGFSLYDHDDQLVICNTRYQELLYPDSDTSFEPGTKYETIIRSAAERGLIANAEGRVDEWVAERMARHRNPGKPHLQHRTGGRWILISERKTDDGGTVAIYADITELKQREEELAEKSNALEQLSNQLAKYLSPQVYDTIFRSQQEVKIVSSRKKLTVFFSDIANFTETADRLQSEELTQLLNHYLTEMSQIALDYGGTIDKYVGDAIMIFFGDPETKGVKEDALACVKMAIAMRKRMDELQHIWQDSGIGNPLHCRMGIHTDYCTVGNFGSETRMDYTIIGGGVNLASRLETAATPGEILISYETHAHVSDQVVCEEYGEIDVKGIAYPVATYKVLDTYENLGRQRRHLREDHPNVKLDLDLDAMTSMDRGQAAKILRRALDMVSSENELAQPVEIKRTKSTRQ